MAKTSGEKRERRNVRNPKAGKNAPRVQARSRNRRGIDLARYHDVDPLEYLILRFRDARSREVKDKMALQLLPYCYPRLRARDDDAATEAREKVVIVIGGDDA